MYETMNEYGVGEDRPVHRRHRGTLSLVLMIAAGIMVAIVGLTAFFWVLGIAFHVAGLVIRVAVVVGVVAFVWKRVVHGRHHKYDY